MTDHPFLEKTFWRDVEMVFGLAESIPKEDWKRFAERYQAACVEREKKGLLTILWFGPKERAY